MFMTNDAYTYKHLYFCAFMTSQVTNYKMIIILAMLGIIYLVTELIVAPLIILAWLAFPVFMNIYAIYNIKKRNLDITIDEFIFDKLLNLYLLNHKLLSSKDWKRIKQASRAIYQNLTSLASANECYRSTFHIANILANKEITILWMLVEIKNQKFGHAVIAKNGYIYDSNFRKTYPKEKYIKASHALIFKELSFDEYYFSRHSNSVEHLEKDWEEFKTFCEDHGGYRSFQDHNPPEKESQ